MNQENFINTYVELLNTTLTEAIQKNVVAQAQKKVFEEELKFVKDELLKREEEFKRIITEKEEQIRAIINDLNDVRKQNGLLSYTVEETKTASQHFETYKNELVATRKKNEELIDLIAQKDKLIADKDEKLKKFGAAPTPVVVNKLGKKQNPTPLEKKEDVVDKSKTIKVKTTKDAGTF